MERQCCSHVAGTMHYQCKCNIHHSHLFLLFLFNRTQQPECSFLGLCQPLHLRNVHAFVRSIIPQCVQTCTSLTIPEVNNSIITAAREKLAIRAEYHRSGPMARSEEHTSELQSQS